MKRTFPSHLFPIIYSDAKTYGPLQPELSITQLCKTSALLIRGGHRHPSIIQNLQSVLPLSGFICLLVSTSTPHSTCLS
ncbi:hypothetical protein AMECASPLE_010646 [Ameca splendens]|uniref:Uncharacterized protein n=1 Tax=Ameca splendens TaxID=208324 RepID=A0ABV0Y109_9TELE